MQQSDWLIVMFGLDISINLRSGVFFLGKTKGRGRGKKNYA